MKIFFLRYFFVIIFSYFFASTTLNAATSGLDALKARLKDLQGQVKALHDNLDRTL